MFLFAMCVMLITAKQLPRIQWPCRWFLCHMSWSVINNNLIETELSIFVWAENCSLIIWHKPSYYNEWKYDCCIMIPPQQMQFFGTWLCLGVAFILDIQVNTLWNAISVKYLCLYFHNVEDTAVEFVMFLGYCKIIQKAFFGCGVQLLIETAFIMYCIYTVYYSCSVSLLFFSWHDMREIRFSVILYVSRIQYVVH